MPFDIINVDNIIIELKIFNNIMLKKNVMGFFPTVSGNSFYIHLSVLILWLPHKFNNTCCFLVLPAGIAYCFINVKQYIIIHEKPKLNWYCKNTLIFLIHLTSFILQSSRHIIDHECNHYKKIFFGGGENQENELTSQSKTLLAFDLQ